MSGKIVRVKIEELDRNLFVRKSLDQDHALHLAELIEGGVKLPPITITAKKVLVDGRHRVEAHEVNNLTEIDAEVVEFANDSEMIAAAFRANLGGSLPPTSQDIEHTVMVLLERRVSQKHIMETLGLPTAMTRRYIQEVNSRMTRQKLQEAADGVAYQGLTVIKAAEQFGVNPDRLKETLSGNRKKQKKGQMQEIKRNFTKRYRSLGSGNAAALRRLFEKFQDGDVSGQQVETIFNKLDQLQKQSARSLGDWKNRFTAVKAS